MGMGSLGAVGSNGQFLQSAGPGALAVWASPASANVLLATTNTWTAQQTYNNTVIVSTTMGMGTLGAVVSNEQFLQSQGPGSTPVWASPASANVLLATTNT